MSRPLKIVTLCTGNVARSVMLGFMLTTIAEASGLEWRVRTAGTHAVEGMAISARTRDALSAIDELGAHHFSAHRSHQLDARDAAWADVILAAGADHVNYVHTHFPEAADKTVQLHRFVRFAPLDGPFDVQLAEVVALGPDPDFDVADPAGGDQDAYDACAGDLWDLAQAFALLTSDEVGGLL